MPQMDTKQRRLSLTLVSAFICVYLPQHYYDKLRHIIPAPQPKSSNLCCVPYNAPVYQEVQSREAIKLYCDWYYTTAERHRQELQQMRSELNILGWFRREDVRESQLRRDKTLFQFHASEP